MQLDWNRQLAQRRAWAFEKAQSVPEAAAAARGAFLGRLDLMAMVATLQQPSLQPPALLKSKIQLLMRGAPAHSMAAGGCAL